MESLLGSVLKPPYGPHARFDVGSSLWTSRVAQCGTHPMDLLRGSMLDFVYGALALLNVGSLYGTFAPLNVGQRDGLGFRLQQRTIRAHSNIEQRKSSM